MKVFMFILVLFPDSHQQVYKVEYPSIEECEYAIEKSKSTLESDTSVTMFCSDTQLQKHVIKDSWKGY